MSVFNKSSQGNVAKDEYFRVFITVGMILRPQIDADDLQKLIKEDFEKDTEDKRDAEDGKGGDDDDGAAQPKSYDYID